MEALSETVAEGAEVEVVRERGRERERGGELRSGRRSKNECVSDWQERG